VGATLGIDFGTTFTKVAYFVDGEDCNARPRHFQHPLAAGNDRIPTIASYGSSGALESVGLVAKDHMRNPRKQRSGRAFFFGYKTLLPYGDSPNIWTEAGWRIGATDVERTPAEVTRDYLGALLCSDDRNSFVSSVGPIDRVVVSVPEIWQRSATNPGGETLLAILREIGLPDPSVRSEPVCAAAAYAATARSQWGNDWEPFPLIVCDVGGGTFDVALCRVGPGHIEVLAFDGNGEGVDGCAGLAFDRSAVMATIAQAHPSSEPTEPKLEHFGSTDPNEAKSKAAPARWRDEENAAVQNEFGLAALLIDFEFEKTNATGELQREHEAGSFDSPLHQDVPLFEFGPYTLTIGICNEAFKPIREGIGAVLTRLSQRSPGQDFADARVAIVGSFGEFPLVESAILEFFGIKDITDPRFDRTLNRASRPYAVATGAALIAAGCVQVTERYPNAIALEVTPVRDGVLLPKGWLKIVNGGEVESGLNNVHFARDDQGRRVAINVTTHMRGGLPVAIQLPGSTDWQRLSLPPHDYPRPGKYYVGVRIDASNLVELHFVPVDEDDASQPGQGAVRPDPPAGGGHPAKARVYRLGDIRAVIVLPDLS
jgi:molecular chaperone DnaK